MEESWRELIVTNEETEAAIVRDLLESGGIPVVIRSTRSTPYPVTVGALGAIEVLVRDEDYDTARRVIGRS